MGLENFIKPGVSILENIHSYKRDMSTGENAFKPFMYTSLRVEDVDRAVVFYQKFGFKNTYEVQGIGHTLISFLEYGGNILIVAKLEGLPYPLTPRETAIQQGPRGLGAKISFNVADLNDAYRLCKNENCEITMEPMDELWGDRIFTCLDPFGYELQIHQNIQSRMNEADLTRAYQHAWASK